MAHQIKSIERVGNLFEFVFIDDADKRTVYTYTPEEVDKVAGLVRRAQKLGKGEKIEEEAPSLIDLFQESKDYVDNRIEELVAAVNAKLEKFEDISKDVCVNMQVNSSGVQRAERVTSALRQQVELLADELVELFDAKVMAIRRAHQELAEEQEEQRTKASFDDSVTESRLQMCEKSLLSSKFSLAELEVGLSRNDLAYHQAGKRLAEAERDLIQLKLEKEKLEKQLAERIQKLENRGFKAWLKRVFGRNK
jgi:hypothetical protein